MNAGNQVAGSAWDNHVVALQRLAAITQARTAAHEKLQAEHRDKSTYATQRGDAAQARITSLRQSLDRATASVEAVYALFGEKRPAPGSQAESVGTDPGSDAIVSDAHRIEMELKQLCAWANNSVVQGRSLARALRNAENEEGVARKRNTTAPNRATPPPAPSTAPESGAKRSGHPSVAVFAVIAVVVIVVLAVLLL